MSECFFPVSNTPVSSDPENFLWEKETVPSNPIRSWLKQESSRGEGGSPPPAPHGPTLWLLLQRGRLADWLVSLVSLPKQLY